MTIFYSVIAKDGSVLVECQPDSPLDFHPIVAQLLPKLSNSNESRKTYNHEGHQFHYEKDGDVIYLCVTDSKSSVQVSFGYLAKMKDLYANTKEQMALRRSLANEMDVFNDPAADKIQSVKAKVDDVKGIMIENISKVLERGEKLEEVLANSEHMSSQAVNFRNRSVDLRRQMCFNNVKVVVGISVVIVVLILLIVVGICGITFGKC